MLARMSLRRLLVVLVLAASCAKSEDAPKQATEPAKGADAPAKTGSSAPPTASGIDAAFIAKHTKILSADDMGGRRPGTPGAARARDHIVATMEAIGLEPAGEDGYTQKVPMRAVQAVASSAKFSMVKGKTERELRFGEQIVGASFGPAGPHPVDAPLVFLGYGVSAPEQKWDDYDGVNLEGKVAVVFVGDPPLEDGRFGGNAMTYYGRWTYKFERALEAGAAGCLVVHETAPASYGWNVVHNSWTNERFHVMEPGGELPAALPFQGWISADAADALAKMAGSSLKQWHEMALAPDFVPVQTGVTLRGSVETTERQLEDVNIAGAVKGSTAPEEAVILTAHWDHLGRKSGAKDGEDAIFNGALDNASGTATLLAIAAELQKRVKAGQRPARSIVFLAVTAEEQGLLGSKYYAAHPTFSNPSIRGVVNMDSVNVWGRTKDVQVIGMGQSTLEDLLSGIIENQGRRMIPDENPERGSYYRSDHFSFAKVGIPALYFRGGKDMEEGGPAAGKDLAKKKAANYHTVSDEFDATWTFGGAVQDAEAILDLAQLVANAKSPPAWKPTSEFAKVARR